MPNLTYWLFGGYLAWLYLSGQYKSMASFVTVSAWPGSTSHVTPSTPASDFPTTMGVPTNQSLLQSEPVSPTLAQENKSLYSGGGL